MRCLGCRSSHCMYLELLLSLKHARVKTDVRLQRYSTNGALMHFFRDSFSCNCRGTASPTRLGSLPDQKAQLSIGSFKVMT